jgi:hypothetical protein
MDNTKERHLAEKSQLQRAVRTLEDNLAEKGKRGKKELAF